MGKILNLGHIEVNIDNPIDVPNVYWDNIEKSISDRYGKGWRSYGQNEFVRSPSGVYADRIVGGHRHYCRPDCIAAARSSTGPRGRASDAVQEQLEAAWVGSAQLPRCDQHVAAIESGFEI